MSRRNLLQLIRPGEALPGKPFTVQYKHVPAKLPGEVKKI
jgi:hypothetical protein